MKNKIFTLILCASFMCPYSLHAALDFTNATSDRVLVNAASSVNTLATASIIMWVYPTSITSNRAFIRKGNLVTTGWNFGINNVSGDLRAQVGRATTNMNSTTNWTPMAVANKWYCIAFTWDTAGATGQQTNIYVGDLTTPLVEGTYSLQTDGAGAQNGDSGVNINIGNIPTNHANAFPGYIANAILINRTLTVGELISLQYYPRKVSGTVGFWNLGFNGTGSQTDYSGTGNSGTVTGATVAPFHVPLGPLFGR